MGKLVQVATSTVSSPVSSVTLTGIDSDDVYMLAITDLRTDTTNATVGLRPTISGSADANGNKDTAKKLLAVSNTFEDRAITNSNWIELYYLMGSTNTTRIGSGIFYLYNFYSSSEYSFITMETTMTRDSNGEFRSANGGGVFKDTSSCDGFSIVTSATNLASGTFTLYKVL